LARLSVLKSKIIKHLDNNDMSYAEHARFSGGLSALFLKLSVTAAIHAVLPCFFETHSSDNVKDLYWKFASKRK
jgi:hypothetical protein